MLFRSKLSDFGTAILQAAVNADQPNGGAVGTVPYMSPGVLRGTVDASNDMWAVSISVYEMLKGRLPWDTTLDGIQLMYNIGELSEAPDFFSSLRVSTELREAMSQCLRIDGKQRPTAQELLARTYFSSVLQEKDVQSSPKR